jgi:23S rRNA pseudouridine1911/1915/1917 synthase
MNQRIKSFSSDKYQVELPVEPQHDGMRLDQFVQLYMNSFSREVIKKKIQKGEVTISERPGKHRPSTRLHDKEVVTITTYNQEQEELWRGQPIPHQDQPSIVYQDDTIVVAHKPAFMSTHPTGKHLFHCLTIWLEQHFGQVVHNVHRLDRETSGILVFGRSPAITTKLTQSFEKLLVSKAYFLIAKKVKEPRFPLIAKERMGMEDGFHPSMYVHCYPESSGKGKHAETHFYEIASNQRYIIALAFPVTGRQHQIRAHAAFHGFPLLGDKMYSGDPKLFSRYKESELTEQDYQHLEIPRHALHAMGLSVPHPSTQKRLLFHGPLPEDLKEWLRQMPEFDHQAILQSCITLMEEKIETIKIRN